MKNGWFTLSAVMSVGALYLGYLTVKNTKLQIKYYERELGLKESASLVKMVAKDAVDTVKPDPSRRRR